MREIKWLVLVLALAAAAYWFGFYDKQSASTEVAVVDSEVLVAAPAAGLGQVDDSRVANAPADDGNWLTHGRTFDEQRFSPLTQINRDTVSGLGLAWFRDMGTNRTLEATPIVVDGVMFFSGAWSRVYAMSADDGEMLWSFDPKVAGEWGRRTCCDVINRGVAVYRGKVVENIGSAPAAARGYLKAFDPLTGEARWTVELPHYWNGGGDLFGPGAIDSGEVLAS